MRENDGMKKVVIAAAVLTLLVLSPILFACGMAVYRSSKSSVGYGAVDLWQWRHFVARKPGGIELSYNADRQIFVLHDTNEERRPFLVESPRISFLPATQSAPAVPTLYQATRGR